MFPNQIMNLIAGKVALGRIQSYMQVSRCHLEWGELEFYEGMAQPCSSLISHKPCACPAGTADLHAAWSGLSCCSCPSCRGPQLDHAILQAAAVNRITLNITKLH